MEAVIDRPSEGAHSEERPGLRGYLTPFWVFLAATFLYSFWMLLAQATTGLVYVVTFLPVIPLMLIYAIILQSSLNMLHILTARLFGFRIEMLAVGPIELYRDGRRTTRLTGNWSAFGTARIVAPASIWQTVRSIGLLLCDAALLLVLGMLGLLANVTLLAIGIPPIIVDMFPVAFTQIAGMIAVVMSISVAVELAVELTTSPKQRGVWACQIICEQSPELEESELDQLRPRAWPADLIRDQASAKFSRSNRDATEGILRAYYHFLDSGAVLEAGAFIDRALAYAGPFANRTHERVYPESAYFLARVRHNPTAARARLNQKSKKADRPQVVLRAEAAIALAEGRPEDTVAKATEALALVDSKSPPGIAAMEHELLASLIEDANAAIREKSSTDPTSEPPGTPTQQAGTPR